MTIKITGSIDFRIELQTIIIITTMCLYFLEYTQWRVQENSRGGGGGGESKKKLSKKINENIPLHAQNIGIMTYYAPSSSVKIFLFLKF